MEYTTQNYKHCDSAKLLRLYPTNLTYYLYLRHKLFTKKVQYNSSNSELQHQTYRIRYARNRKAATVGSSWNSLITTTLIKIIIVHCNIIIFMIYSVKMHFHH
jgi:hypothetical protein